MKRLIVAAILMFGLAAVTATVFTLAAHAQQPPQKATLELTLEEGNALLLLLDLAVKHPDKGGLAVASNANHFANKLRQAFEAKPPAAEPKKEE